MGCIRMPVIKIGDRLVGDNQPVFVIVEIGVNHNGSIAIAKQLIDIAVRSGADAVKFQRRVLEHVYQKEILSDQSSEEQSFQYLIPILKEFELSNEEYYEIVKYCKEKEIMFLCTPWDIESVDFLEKLGVPAYKISSADMTNFVLLDYIVKKNKPLIVSTGMSTLDELDKTVKFLNERNAEFILLHCNSAYPAPFHKLNLRFIHTLKERYGVPVGYSGHERGIAMSTVAAAFGACVIERHITLDRTMVGPDHAASLEPQGLAKMIKNIRQAEVALGTGEKMITRGEILNRELLGKSLVTAKPVPKGTTITREMITAKSPGKGLSPQLIGELVGRKAIRDINMDEAFTEEDIGIKRDFSFIKSKHFEKKWGFKVRFDNIDDLVKYNPKIVEFHFTEEDIPHEFEKKHYEQELCVHTTEYWQRSLVDLCTLDESLRKKSINAMQMNIDKTLELAPYFKGKPKLIVHVGGMSLQPIRNISSLMNTLEDSLSKLRFGDTEFVPENLPPRPWYFGGQWISNVFVAAEEFKDFCKSYGCGMCLDLSHAAMYCNLHNKDLYEYIRIVKPHVRQLHVSDAVGIDGEGLQIGEGQINFDKVFEILKNYDGGIIPEIWRGHQKDGEGFLVALQRLANYLK